MRLTDIALPEVVRLRLRGFISRELPVDLVLDVAHGDESGHDACPAARFHCERMNASEVVKGWLGKTELTCSGDGTVVHVPRGGETGSAVVLCQKQHELTTGRVGVHDLAMIDDPVCEAT